MKNKIKVFEAFSGYGSQAIALRNIGIEYEVVAISEIDKHAICAYEAIHGPTLNLGDISKIKLENIPSHDLFTYSFPCQDISVAGKKRGLVKGQTRSGLLYECERIIKYCKPKYLLMENVKNLVNAKFKPQFDEWLSFLETLGYTNYWKILNAKDYGVPQNRERVFVISILGEHKPFIFSNPIYKSKLLDNILEQNINTKYYLEKDSINRLKITNSNLNKVFPCENFNFNQAVEVSQISKFITLDEYQKKHILPCIGASRGRYIIRGYKETEQRLEINSDRISNTITTVLKDNYLIESNLKIRRLTERETFRLMGMNDTDIDKIQSKQITSVQQYKLAGNSIVIPVLESILRDMFTN